MMDSMKVFDRMLSVLKILFTPYFLLNGLMSLAYVLSKNFEATCRLMYHPQEDCSFDWRDQEVMMFLCFVIIIKNRRWKPNRWTEYLGNVFMLSKGASAIMFLRKGTFLGIGYICLCIVIFLIAPEPSYSGRDNIEYFIGQALEEELAKNRNVVYLVEFYATWSSPCSYFAETFAEISLSYSHEYLKFGKLDVGRYPSAARRYHIDSGVRSKQLPTLILFADGVEKLRRPLPCENEVSWYYRFTKENIIRDFNLNEHYSESQKRLLSELHQDQG